MVRREAEACQIRNHQRHLEVTHHILALDNAVSRWISMENGEKFPQDVPSMSSDVPGKTRSQRELRNLPVKIPRKAPKHLV